MMVQFYHEGDINCAPDLITFSTVLKALARDNNDVNADVGARKVLDTMLNLCGALPEEKVGTNEESEAEADDSIIPKSISYQYDIVPRNMHFNMVLNLLAKKGQVNMDMLQSAKRYVGIMEKLGKQEKKNLPNTHNENDVEDEEHYDHDDEYNLYNNGEGKQWSKKASRGMLGPLDPAYEEIRKSRRISIAETNSAPDIVSYNTLLKIAARTTSTSDSKSPFDPQLAEDILNDMINKSSTGKSDVKPDRTSFNTVSSLVDKFMSHQKDRTVFFPYCNLSLLRSFSSQPDLTCSHTCSCIHVKSTYTNFSLSISLLLIILIHRCFWHGPNSRDLMERNTLNNYYTECKRWQITVIQMLSLIE